MSYSSNISIKNALPPPRGSQVTNCALRKKLCVIKKERACVFSEIEKGMSLLHVIYVNCLKMKIHYAVLYCSVYM